MSDEKEMFGPETGLGTDRDDYEQVTVWPPKPDGVQHVWFENEDGECSIEFTIEERRWLVAQLSVGL